MYILKYFPYILLAFFSLKFLILFINENTNILKEQIKSQKIEKGLLSIRDIQSSNILRFSQCCEEFLTSYKYINIVKISSNINSIDFTANLDNSPVFIRCISTDFSDTASVDSHSLESSQVELELLLGKMIHHSCNSGVLICNSNFSSNCLEFLDTSINTSLKDKITLIDGYTLSKHIRNLRIPNIISEDLA